jgi:hypothetical protein
MAIRKYDFVSGFETETLPTSGDPSGDSDLINLGYANANYTSIFQVKGVAATNAAIKAIPLAARADNQIIFNVSNSAFYRFESSSSAVDDGDTVLTPDDAPVTGRWLKTAVFASAADARVDVLYEFIVGTALQVSAGEATHSSFSSAQTAASDGDSITILPGTLTENITVSKRLLIEGRGPGSVIDGTVTFASGSNYTHFKDLKVLDDVTINSGTKGLLIDINLAAGQTITNNNPQTEQSNFVTWLEED